MQVARSVPVVSSEQRTHLVRAESGCDGVEQSMRAARAATLRQSAWRKSSWSAHNGNCVEVAEVLRSQHAVRDSMDKAGPVLIFSRAEWFSFLGRVSAGEFDG